MRLSDKNNKTYWVYILLCDNGTFYTGYTNNLVKRYRLHLIGHPSCKYTRSFKPLGIAQCWEVMGDKSLALKLEGYIKKLSRKQKEQVISNPAMLSCDPRVKSISIRLEQIS